jgi:pyruvate dehydrogenase (quinone)
VGDPRFGPSQTIVDFPYAAYAELLHLGGIRVHKPEQIGDAWDEALSADRPVVLDVLTDLEVPILPPHITLEEARNFMFAIAKGDEGGFKLLRRGIKATAKEFLK